LPQYEFNIKDYTRIFYKRKFLVLATLLTGVIAGLILFPPAPPVYKSSTTVKIEERKTIAGLLTEWIVYNPGDIMASQTNIIKGYPIIRHSAIRLGLIQEDSPMDQVHKVVSNLQEKIETKRLDQTNIIEITGISNIAEDAMNLANTVAAVYVEENLREKREQARSSRLFIEEQLLILNKRLEESERTMGGAKEEASRLKELAYSGKETGNLQENLVELKYQLARLSQRYTGKNPKIIELKQQINDLESRLEIKSDSYALQNMELSEQELKQVKLAREVEINTKLYMMFKEKLEEARITEAQKVGDVSIIDPAVLSNAPVNTAGNINVLLGGLIGLLTGIGLVFVLEAMDRSIWTVEEAENIMKLPVLGVVPSADRDIKKGRSKPASNMPDISSRESADIYIRMITHHLPTSLMAESFRNIRTNLRLGPSRKTILVTSAGAGEGKTTVLVNLGLAVAQTGAKTLLVSSDLRKPAVSRSFGIRSGPGLTEVISGTATLDEALKNISDIILGDAALEMITGSSGMDNIWILPSGHPPVNPAEILESGKNVELIEELRRRFNYIFFDSPPVLPVTDASLLASRVDSVVLCYQVGKLPRESLLRAKIQIESVGANISGIVLNHNRLQKGTALHPIHYGDKESYYGEQSQPV